MSSRRQPSLPPKLAGFEYVGLLGMGGFADVFEYRQDFPRRSVAVKVLLDSSVDAGSRDAFFAEANIMAGLSQHPSIVTIHQAAISADGRPYFIMEYCSRPSLGARFRNERISVAETLRTGIRVASAVETAHRLGVLHRDIKPANILATDFGWPALTDFGIAGTVGEKLVASGMSIPWAPPELLADEPFGDARSDVYSLAATLYSLLAGRSPFEVPGQSNSPIDLITRIEREPLKTIDRVDVPQSLNLVLARAMAKDPTHRFSSAVAFAHALQSIEREMQLPVTGIDVTDLTPARLSSSHPSAQSGAEDGIERAKNRTEGHEVGDSSPNLPVTVRGTYQNSIADRPTTSAISGPAPDTTSGPDQPNAADIETRLRPVTTVRLDEPTPPTAPRQVTWSPTAAKAALNQAMAPTEFEETTGSNGYFYAKRKKAELEIGPAHKRLTLLVSIASVLLLALALLFIGNNALRSQQRAPEAALPTTSAPQIDTGSVPPVKDLTVTQETDKTVRFTWKNPEPQTGDTYTWRTVELNGYSDTQRISDTFVEVTKESKDAQVCVEVSLVRVNGKMSNTPSKECN